MSGDSGNRRYDIVAETHRRWSLAEKRAMVTDGGTALRVDAMDLKDRLCDVETDRRDCLHDKLLRIAVTSSATDPKALARPIEEPSTASIRDIRDIAILARRDALPEAMCCGGRTP